MANCATNTDVRIHTKLKPGYARIVIVGFRLRTKMTISVRQIADLIIIVEGIDYECLLCWIDTCWCDVCCSRVTNLLFEGLNYEKV